MPMPDSICSGRRQDSYYYWVDYTSSQLDTEARTSDVFKIASALGTTVEYLCNGESDYYQSRYINLKNAIKEILEKY